MFEHSVKVPRIYKVAANIFKKVSTEGGSVKTLLYDDKLRHFRTNVLYALITETIKHAADIDKIFESSSLINNEPRLDPWLAKVLTAELLFGKKALPGKSKPEQTILSYKEKFEQYTADHPEDLKTEAVRRPRYVRINTNLLTTSDAIRAFQDEEYRFIRCTSGSYDDYLAQIKSLGEYDFTQDYHVKTVFVFSSGTKLHEHELYMENKIILQDKATTLAVHLLAAPPGSVALDMCAAPGMKTTQLAAYMRNEGKIYAVERNEQRYKTLCDFVEKTGCKCVETLHKDALEIRRGDYDDVEYILLDPSCSGSGMELCVHKYIEETRLAKLTSLQEKFLKHAMNAFPNAKRIVYSTCSLFPEENERVVTNVVKTSRTKWRVQDVKELLKGQWNNVGSGMYGSMGTRCLYARPESDYTTGFFLAVLDRDQKVFEKKANEEKNGVKKEKSTKDVSEVTEEVKKKKHKKDKKKYETNGQCDKNSKNVESSTDHEQDTSEVAGVVKKKKHKKKLKNDETNRQCDENEVIDGKSTKITKGHEEDMGEVTEVKKKKHKKDKKKYETNGQCDKNSKNVESSTDHEQDTSEVAGVVKKKKHKKKLKNDETNRQCDENEVIDGKSTKITKGHEEDMGEVTEVKKKKHKGSLKNDETDGLCENDVVDTELTGDVSKKKKKRKHKNQEENEQNNGNADNEAEIPIIKDTDGVPEKKKRKNNESLAEDGIGRSSKKKKKSKYKHQTNEESLETGDNVISEERVKEKKKKKKREKVSLDEAV